MSNEKFVSQFLDGATNFATGTVRRKAGNAVEHVADQLLLYARRHQRHAPSCLIEGRRSDRHVAAQELLLDAVRG